MKLNYDPQPPVPVFPTTPQAVAALGEAMRQHLRTLLEETPEFTVQTAYMIEQFASAAQKTLRSVSPPSMMQDLSGGSGYSDSVGQIYSASAGTLGYPLPPYSAPMSLNAEAFDHSMSVNKRRG